jgi:hypothetical protein
MSRLYFTNNGGPITLILSPPLFNVAFRWRFATTGYNSSPTASQDLLPSKYYSPYILDAGITTPDLFGSVRSQVYNTASRPSSLS